jgi:hypothetical protein
MKVLYNVSTGNIVERFDDDVTLSGIASGLATMQLTTPIGEEVTNISGVTSGNLVAFKAQKKSELEVAVTNFICADYPVTNQTSIMMEKINGAAGAKLAQINAVENWINGVLTEYYLRSAELNAATTAGEVNAITSNFSSLLATKPSYTLRTIRMAANS